MPEVAVRQHSSSWRENNQVRFFKRNEAKCPKPIGEEAKPYFVDSFAEPQHGRKELE